MTERKLPRSKRKARDGVAGSVCIGNNEAALLDRVFGQVAVGFRELHEFGLVINIGVGKREGTRSTGDVGFDIADTCDFEQIASDRGGTGTSDHVGNFEANECRRLTSWNGLRGCVCRGLGHRGVGGFRASDDRQQRELANDQIKAVHQWAPLDIKNVVSYSIRARPLRQAWTRTTDSIGDRRKETK